jgi:hypothetical protein
MDAVRFRIYNSGGTLVRDTVLAGNNPLYTGDLPSGLYIVKARKKGGKWMTGRLVR